MKCMIKRNKNIYSFLTKHRKIMNNNRLVMTMKTRKNGNNQSIHTTHYGLSISLYENYTNSEYAELHYIFYTWFGFSHDIPHICFACRVLLYVHHQGLFLPFCVLFVLHFHYSDTSLVGIYRSPNTLVLWSDGIHSMSFWYFL